MPYLKSMEVLPTNYALSGWTSKAEPNNYVAETFVANFDSAAEVQSFVGGVGALGNTYNVDI